MYGTIGKCSVVMGYTCSDVRLINQLISISRCSSRPLSPDRKYIMFPLNQAF